MRRKTRTLVGRRLAIALGSMAGLYSNRIAWLLIPIVLVVVSGVTTWRSLRQITDAAFKEGEHAA